MADESSSGFDLLGIKPVAQAIHAATEAAVTEAKAIFECICLPAAEEFGLFLKDRVSYYRACNSLALAQKLKRKMIDSKIPTGAHAHPRIAHDIIEKASWSSDSEIQDMWAGLLSSACTEKGDDESNLIFTDLLGRLTKLQAKILKYGCEKAPKIVNADGFIAAFPLLITIADLFRITEENDLNRLDRELDHLRSLSLLSENGGFRFENPGVVDLAPSALALNMYVRCQGSRLSPVEYFKLLPIQASSPSAQ